MKWLLIPIEDLKQFDTYWKDRVTNIDGTKAIIHLEIYDSIVPKVQTLDMRSDEELQPVEESYPYPLIDEANIQAALEESDIVDIEEVIVEEELIKETNKPDKETLNYYEDIEY